MRMKLYQGIVEDISDPLKVGRVRVRVFGLHTDDTNLIPTDTLPWATVMQPTTSASISGIGHGAVGLLPGSWVVVFFQDPEEQYPVVLGSFHGIPRDLASQVTADEESSFEYSDNEAATEQNTLKDGSGNVVTDGNGAPIATTPPLPVEGGRATGKVDSAKLGSVSAKYESNGNPASINKYANGDDLGGASYGAYQFASYMKAATTPTRPHVTLQQINTSPINTFIKFAELTQFAGLVPASEPFDAAWKAWANADKPSALALQHKYIEQKYYQLTIAKLPMDVVARGVAVHEMIWSMAVQLGQSGAATKIKSVANAFDGAVCDHVLIEAVYDSRIKTVQSDFKSSPKQWGGLVQRFIEERNQLVALAKTYQTGECSGSTTPVETKRVVYKETAKSVVTETKAQLVPASKGKGKRGFVDPSGEYPMYYDESDVHRLARGILTGTIVERKRNEVIVNADAGEGSISEPTTQYNTKYPYNKVIATRSGHVIEFDDTPGHERVHVYHRSGTFVEMYPDGKLVTKVKGDNTLVVNSDSNTIILGDQNTSVSGNSNVTVSGSIHLIVNGNISTTVYGDVKMNAIGTTSIKSSKIDLN